MPFSPQHIRVLSVGVIRRGRDILAVKGYDPHKLEYFYRLLGGGIEFGETAEQTLRREFMEELSLELENLRYKEVIENIFTYNNHAGHEIVFVYEADLVNKSLYAVDKIAFHERGRVAEYAEWINPQKNRVYPQIKF